jgi:hypothetical protein
MDDLLAATHWSRLYGLDTPRSWWVCLGVALKLAPAGTYPKVKQFRQKLALLLMAWLFIVGCLPVC